MLAKIEQLHEELGRMEYIPYKSYKLHQHEADSSSIHRLSLDQRTAVLHLAQRLQTKELTEVYESRSQSIALSKSLWSMFSALIAAATELSVCHDYIQWSIEIIVVHLLSLYYYFSIMLYADPHLHRTSS